MPEHEGELDDLGGLRGERRRSRSSSGCRCTSMPSGVNTSSWSTRPRRAGCASPSAPELGGDPADDEHERDADDARRGPAGRTRRRSRAGTRVLLDARRRQHHHDAEDDQEQRHAEDRVEGARLGDEDVLDRDDGAVGPAAVVRRGGRRARSPRSRVDVASAGDGRYGCRRKIRRCRHRRRLPGARGPRPRSARPGRRSRANWSNDAAAGARRTVSPGLATDAACRTASGMT